MTWQYLNIGLSVGIGIGLLLLHLTQEQPLVQEDFDMGDEGRNIPSKPEEAKEARDADLAQVSEHNVEWMACALEVIETLPDDFRGIGEDINVLIKEKVGEPKSPNAFGALINKAKKRNLIRWTGEMAPMRGLKSNARMSFVYVKGDGLVELKEAAE